MRTLISTIILAISFSFVVQSQNIEVGAKQWQKYSSVLKNKKVGLIVNQTSRVGKEHLIDFLLQKEVDVTRIFAPEHGFRGKHGAGEKVLSSIDEKTGIRIISLYGKHKKPLLSDLIEVDILVFDIQDVGCRFYTYISTMHYCMEVAAEKGIPFLVLDRPNPNGDYVAGPVLSKYSKSFVGMHPIPVVHGCTVGELAMMINGEGWLNRGLKCKLTVVPVKNYTHSMRYSLPVAPSPNLPNDLSIRLYPSLCFFEATSVSVGRGTHFPFQVAGHPLKMVGNFEFIPKPIKDVVANPKHSQRKCYGVDYRKLKEAPQMTMDYFMQFYNAFDAKTAFLIRPKWLIKLYGNGTIINMLAHEKSAKEIEDSWQPELKKYKRLRSNYLLYPDFE